jgi:hypothetical protein
MFKKARKALVESFVGAIALGCVFAYGVFNLVEAVSVPISNWAAQQYMVSFSNPSVSRRVVEFPWLVVARPLFQGAALVLVGYLLLRWLYYPTKQTATAATGVSAEAPQGDESPTPTN